MKFKDALESLDREQLIENHKSTTRETCRGWVRDYLNLLKSREVDVKTTEIYTHAVGFHGTESPLDKLGMTGSSGAIIQFPRTA